MKITKLFFDKSLNKSLSEIFLIYTLGETGGGGGEAEEGLCIPLSVSPEYNLSFLLSMAC